MLCRCVDSRGEREEKYRISCEYEIGIGRQALGMLGSRRNEVDGVNICGDADLGT